MNGGYALIDCTGVDLNDLGTVPGLYAKVKEAVDANKPMWLINIVNDDQAFSAIPAFGGNESGGVFVSFYPATLHITSADVVSM